jgi:hypothetical protein
MSSAFFFLRVNDHVNYLKRIEKTLEGSGDFRGTEHADCKLGVWMQGEGRGEAEALGPEGVRVFDELVAPHQAFHEASSRAIALKESGDAVGSQAAITEMMKLSVSLINRLMDLDKLSAK